MYKANPDESMSTDLLRVKRSDKGLDVIDVLLIKISKQTEITNTEKCVEPAKLWRQRNESTILIR